MRPLPLGFAGGNHLSYVNVIQIRLSNVKWVSKVPLFKRVRAQ
jgi:hypothetical protein